MRRSWRGLRRCWVVSLEVRDKGDGGGRQDMGTGTEEIRERRGLRR